MDTYGSAVKTEGESEKPEDEKKDGEEAKDSDKSETLKKRMEKEKVGYNLDNMSRVLPAQLKFVSFHGRYEPVKKPTGGVILLHDTTPEEPKILLEMKKAKKPTQAAAAPETLQDRVDAAMAAQGHAGGDGAAEAAGVLTAIDEGGEGDSDAEMPHEFEYHSDGEHGEE